jgi:hypothetical protein
LGLPLFHFFTFSLSYSLHSPFSIFHFLLGYGYFAENNLRLRYPSGAALIRTMPCVGYLVRAFHSGGPTVDPALVDQIKVRERQLAASIQAESHRNIFVIIRNTNTRLIHPTFAFNLTV